MRVVSYAGAPYLLAVEGNKARPLHRVIMEEELGRPLTDGEIVHHIDGNKRNNSPSNLVVMGRREHTRLHIQERWAVRFSGQAIVRRPCVICERPLGRCICICMQCRTEFDLHDKPYAEWPEWVKECVRLRNREARHARIERAKTTSLEDMEGRGWQFEQLDYLFGRDVEVHQPDNYRGADPPDALMDYAPYADEDANAVYRRSCGMGERVGEGIGDI